MKLSLHKPFFTFISISHKSSSGKSALNCLLKIPVTAIALVVTLLIISGTDRAYSQAGTYYNSINTSASTLVTDLKERIRNPYNRISYDNYDETIIANFEAVNNGNGTKSVFCVYSGFEYIYSGVFAWGTMSREHTWAHSWMPTFPSTNNDQYSDQYLVYPTHQNNANARRSNHPFGKVVNVTYQFLEGKVGTDSSGNIVYEPRDSFKGNLARALLYAVIRYDDISGNSWSFNWLNGTKLPSLSEAPQNLNLLLNWHRQDPPDKREVDRSNYIQSIQLNRNPFIDKPEYAAYVDFNNVIKLSPVYAAEPSNHLSAFGASAGISDIVVNWNDATGPQLPDGYMIVAYNRDDYFIPIDGSVYPNDSLLADGFACVHVPYSAANNYTFSGLQSNTRYYFTAYPYFGSGSQRNYKTGGSVPRANDLVNPNLALEPANHATGFAASRTTSSTIQLIWNDALPGVQAPSGYLISANNTGSFNHPSDGLQYTDDPVLADGFALVNIPYAAANTYTFTGLLAGTTYHFRIYSYNGTDIQINYKTDGTIPQTAAATQTASVATVTVVMDDFERSNSNILGITLLGSEFSWQETETSAPGSISVSSSRMKMAGTVAGRDFAYTNLSPLKGYVSTFSNADTTLVWAFNMRQSRADPSGHDNNNYGLAFVLGKSTTDLATGSGYAVVLGQSGSTDAIRLARFTAGVIGNNKFTNVISGGDYANQFLSIKVTYVPSTGIWSLFADSSSSAFPQTDPRNTITQIGSSADNTFTGISLPFAGAIWNHATSANDSAVYDDIYLTDLSLKAQISVIPEGLLNTQTGTLNMKDTVTAFLRDPVNPYSIIDSAKAVIDSITFTAAYKFSRTISGSYYLAFGHRNSIETWSFIPLSFSHGNPLTFDMTSQQGNAYGTNTVLKGGKYCIYTGDINQDGTVDGYDLSVIDNEAFIFTGGYVVTDLNGDGFTDATDAALADNNAFNYVSKLVP